MSIAEELERHAKEELQHALTIARQVDYLGEMPTATALPVKLIDDAVGMLRADLANENDTVRNYRERVRQCEALGEYGIAEEIREILRQSKSTSSTSPQWARTCRTCHAASSTSAAGSVMRRRQCVSADWLSRFSG